MNESDMKKSDIGVLNFLPINWYQLQAFVSKMCISAIPQTWVAMVPKDVIAWRKVRASAWKLISGVSSGVRLSEDNLKQQKMSHIYHLLRHSSEIHIDCERYNPLQRLCWHVVAEFEFIAISASPAITWQKHIILCYYMFNK